jgi:hypothetical protein
MSTHLLIAAAYLEDLPQATKLVLMAVADSADEHTLEAAPGLPKLRAWSGRSKSQTLAIVRKLIDDGYVEHLVTGRVGRRAVYRVFPAGVPAIPHPNEVAARYADDSEPVDNPPNEGPAGKTLDPTPGSGLPPSRVLPTGPLQSYPSVSTRAAPSTGAPGPGFPGSRATTAEERDIARRARGALNVPCPEHPDQFVPCGRCAKAANEVNPVKVAAYLAEAKAAARRSATPTATEETP